MENTQLSHQAQSSFIIKQVISSWLAQNKAIDDFFAKHEDDIYMNEVAPGRNTAVYLLAHLIATNDGIVTLLDLGERLFPELAPLAAEPETAVPFKLSINELKRQWGILNEFLEYKFNAMPVSDWLEGHTAVSAEDFLINPMRNKLSILISRASHENYHRGQLIFLNEKLAK